MRKVILIILDGWGIAKNSDVSAIDLAHTPFVDGLYHSYPNSRLHASGLEVGLPDGQMGNSEVGHMNLGAGRVVYQDLVRISNAIADESFFENPTLNQALTKALENPGRPLHIMGLLSDGGVHAHIDHIIGLVEAAHRKGIAKVCLHMFTDGRDTDPQGGKMYVQKLESAIQGKNAQITSVVGRYYAMDRDKRWERVGKAYDLLVHANGTKVESATEALEASYASGITDEFVEAHWLGTSEDTIQPGDVVINANFRTDRGRQISVALTQSDFPEHGMHKLNLHYFTLTNYDPTFNNVGVMFDKDNLSNTLGEVLANHGKKQIRIAETEKYPHVTFFFSGGREQAFEGEKRILCPSPKVATYDLQPEMSARDIVREIVPELESREADFICLNFANPDMVGHTGVMEAAVKACEVVDSCTKQVVEAALENDYTCLILADHGNADCMKNADGSPNTAHTNQPVPFFLVDNTLRPKLRDGKLGDIAPTVLQLLDIAIPQEMSGELLIEKHIENHNIV